MFFDSAAVNRAIVREMHAIGEDWVAGARRWLDEHGTNFKGLTQNTVFYEVQQALDEVILEAGANTGYSYWVEYGRGPGKQPPRHKIRQWVQVKLGITEPGRLEIVARRIAEKIAAKGTKAQPFMRESLEELLPEIPDRLEAAIANAIEAG